MISIDSIASQMANQIPQNTRMGGMSGQLKNAAKIGEQMGSQMTQSAGIGSRSIEQPGKAFPSISGTGSVGNTINKFVGEVDAQMKTSQAERTKVLSGDSSNLHQAMIASQESNIAFTFMVEMRNKLVESYQELMRAQI